MTTAARPTDAIFEAFAASSQRKLREGVVEGVKIVGTASRNGRGYPSETLRKAISLYEGNAVYFNHPGRGPQDASLPRSYGDRFGNLRNVRLGADGLYGDLHYNPKHPNAQQFAWDAENATEGVGLSHNASVRYGADGKTVIEIAAVRSVDIVDRPGTTISLFESELPMEVAPVVTAPAATSSENAVSDGFRSAILKVLDDKGLDLKAKLKKIGEIMKAEAKLAGIIDNNANGVPDNEEGGATEQLRKQVEKLSTALEQAEAKAKAAELKEAIEAECKAAGLNVADPVQVSEQFLGVLKTLPDAAARKPHIDERVNLVGSRKPGQTAPQVKPVTTPAATVTEQQQPSAQDAESWARRLKSRR